MNLDIRQQLNELDKEQLDIIIDALHIYSSEDPEYESKEEKIGMILFEADKHADTIQSFLERFGKNK